MIAAALRVEVCQHDDGSSPGMHDLNLVHLERLSGSVEVTMAADEHAIKLGKLLSRGKDRWIEPDLQGGWMVTVERTASHKRLVLELPALLRKLEGRGQTELGRYRPRTEHDPVLARVAQGLGVVDAIQWDTKLRGTIYGIVDLPLDRRGGFVSASGEALVFWAGAFLADQMQADVRRKLHRSGADERHAFIVVPGLVTTAPFGVSDMLRRGDGSVPQSAPALPPEVTHLWLASTWATGAGLRWSPEEGWGRFSTLFDETGHLVVAPVPRCTA